MKPVLCALLLALFLVPFSSRPLAQTSAQSASRFEAYGKLPLSFEANRGQTDRRVDFISHSPGYTLFLSPSEMVFQLSEAKASILRLTLVGANSKPAVKAFKEFSQKTNYFVGNDPAHWQTGIPNFGKVEYSNVYPGIDVVYYGTQRQLEHDFVVAPGADPGAIALAVDGAESVSVSDQGDLVLQAHGGGLRLQKPHIYQDDADGPVEISGGFRLTGDRRIGFDIGSYDPTRALVIDPIFILYGTYLGGSFYDTTQGIAMDAAGSIYVGGFTGSRDFPTVNAIQPDNRTGDSDHYPYQAFVTKLNSAGTEIIYSTYLGGSSFTEGFGLAVDGPGNVSLTGITAASDFPLVHPLQTSLNGNQLDAFVARLSPAGTLAFATYLGGTGNDAAQAIARDSAGNTYVTGSTDSTDFPLVNPLQNHSGGSDDAFIVKLDAADRMVYSTYLGGSSYDNPSAISLDPSGSAYVTGTTYSTDFPLMTPLQSRIGGGGSDAFVAKINPSGTSLVYSTYLGGSLGDEGYGIAVDSAGNAHLTGRTFSRDFPLQYAAQGSLKGQFQGDAYVTRLTAAGSLAYSTYLGGSAGQSGYGIAVDVSGNAYVTGYTSSTDFPALSAAQDRLGGAFDESDAFVTKVSPAGTIAYSTYLGGSANEIGQGIVVDSVGNAYVAGDTNSLDFPRTGRAVQSALAGPFTGRFDGGYNDGFIAKVGFAVADFRPVVTAPAPIQIPATDDLGTSAQDSPLLAVFLNGGSATDPVDGPPVRLAPQINGVDITPAKIFPRGGVTLVTFRFHDAEGNIGTATSTVTVFPLPRLSVTVVGKGTQSTGYYIDLKLTNTGTGDARQLTISQLQLKTLTGAGTVTLLSALPLRIGSLDTGNPVTVRILLNRPATVTRFSITESGTVQGVSGDVISPVSAFSMAQSVIP